MIRPADDKADRQAILNLTAGGDDPAMAALYAEFAEEDRALAEAGMSEYAAGLAREDADATQQKPAEPTLHPLRVPSGWEIRWNVFYERELTEEAIACGIFGNDETLLWAVHPKRRFGLYMDWQPEPGLLGCFCLSVLYAPYQLTPQGRYFKASPLEFSAEPVGQFKTQSHSVMAQKIEEWLMRCPELVHGPEAT